MRNLIIFYLSCKSSYSQCVGCNVYFYEINFSLLKNEDKLIKNEYIVEQDTIKFMQKSVNIFVSDYYSNKLLISI